ncbi:hypothetical protein NM208_g17197 [Fusarium decemcellulare]|uniref:Uncharacterized protein n=1 Tax=Fusarium decemcellulare TaxID=57161 RepID=A0ACC1RC68_9HYPO|nr:hypothetical protein NM208_g17197 [Fusarium decemcellulare]
MYEVPEVPEIPDMPEFPDRMPRSRAASRFSVPRMATGPDYPHMGYPGKSQSHISARNIALPMSGVGSSHAQWDDDMVSVAPSDSISWQLLDLEYKQESPVPSHFEAKAVSVSLPTWKANVGYEEGEEWVVGRMTTGYPR